jgi:hypothetical protein
MKKGYLLWVAFMATFNCFGQTIFINEIHYDNDGGDVDEGVEICGPAGVNLAGYEIFLYNGNGSTYTPTSISLSGTIPNQLNNRGTLWFAQAGIQNGSPDGLALVDNLGNIIQFLSYEGVITATNGPAIGLTSVDIGVTEPGAIGESLQLVGIGNDYSDFSWVGPTAASPGLLNSNQTLSIVKNQIKGFLVYPNPVLDGNIAVSSASNSSKKIQIYSMFGNCVFSKIITSNEIINVSYLTAGMYMIKVEEDAKISTRKLVIK